MVTQQILVLLFLVRIQVAQQNPATARWRGFRLHRPIRQHPSVHGHNDNAGSPPKGTARIRFPGAAGALPLLEPELAQQRLGFGLVAAEADIELHGILRSALREDVVAERRGHLAVEDSPSPWRARKRRPRAPRPTCIRSIRRHSLQRKCGRRRVTWPYPRRRAAPASGPSPRARKSSTSPSKGSVSVCQAMSVRPNDSWRTLA